MVVDSVEESFFFFDCSKIYKVLFRKINVLDYVSWNVLLIYWYIFMLS